MIQATPLLFICFDCWHRPRPFIVILCLFFDLKIVFMFWLFYFIIFIVLTQIFYGLFVVLYLEIYIIMH